eukprot:gene17122-biopygen2522
MIINGAFIRRRQALEPPRLRHTPHPRGRMHCSDSLRVPRIRVSEVRLVTHDVDPFSPSKKWNLLQRAYRIHSLAGSMCTLLQWGIHDSLRSIFPCIDLRLRETAAVLRTADAAPDAAAALRGAVRRGGSFNLHTSGAGGGGTNQDLRG